MLQRIEPIHDAHHLSVQLVFPLGETIRREGPADEVFTLGQARVIAVHGAG